MKSLEAMSRTPLLDYQSQHYFAAEKDGAFSATARKVFLVRDEQKSLSARHGDFNTPWGRSRGRDRTKKKYFRPTREDVLNV